MTDWPQSRVGSLIAKLEGQYGPPALPAFANPFEMILWEVVGYLTDDVRRMEAFEALRERVGLTPDRILATTLGTLSEITRLGGSVGWDDRADRLMIAARLAREHFGEDLCGVLRMPAPKAKKLLMQFPMIGEPGAEKILMFCGALAVLALESNGLRVLVRVGIALERQSYATTYRAVREVTLAELPDDSELMVRAHLLLRQHGQQVCLRNAPLCSACPARAMCDYAKQCSTSD